MCIKCVPLVMYMCIVSNTYRIGKVRIAPALVVYIYCTHELKKVSIY